MGSIVVGEAALCDIQFSFISSPQDVSDDKNELYTLRLSKVMVLHTDVSYGRTDRCQRNYNPAASWEMILIIVVITIMVKHRISKTHSKRYSEH